MTLMTKKMKKEQRIEAMTVVVQEVIKMSKGEVMAALKRMKTKKALGPDDKAVEVSRCLGDGSGVFDWVV